MAKGNLALNWQPELAGLFEGWTCEPEQGLLCDADGNVFPLDEVRSLVVTRQLVGELVGSGVSGTVASLKQHLDARIRAARTPAIIVRWGDGASSMLLHPDYPDNPFPGREPDKSA